MMSPFATIFSTFCNNETFIYIGFPQVWQDIFRIRLLQSCCMWERYCLSQAGVHALQTYICITTPTLIPLFATLTLSHIQQKCTRQL